ncbi:hypothetical protein E2C01_021086 [Portunus trituberculatus]|uniref:Uncharacterized protein n=1 Tax=Portunus trituberculatus TaxID=210409 RepID=A0A5B7E3H7_PORTR|nr:hypothetical protein [Portunus trituberculatus]
MRLMRVELPCLPSSERWLNPEPCVSVSPKHHVLKATGHLYAAASRAGWRWHGGHALWGCLLLRTHRIYITNLSLTCVQLGWDELGWFLGLFRFVGAGTWGRLGWVELG